MKRVILIHRWDGSPEADWYPWIKEELENKGFKVEIPEMPNSSEPKVDVWVNYLLKNLKNVDKDTFFIGHSVGCQTILRYLSKLNKEIGGAIFVAGWFELKGLETEEEKFIANPWLKADIDFSKIKKSNFVAIFSDDDPFVSLENSQKFKQEIGAKIIIEKAKGHFNDYKAPIVLKEVLKLLK